MKQRVLLAAAVALCLAGRTVSAQADVPVNAADFDSLGHVFRELLRGFKGRPPDGYKLGPKPFQGNEILRGFLARPAANALPEGVRPRVERVSHQDPEAFWRRLREENRHRAQAVGPGLVVVKASFKRRGFLGARREESVASGFFVDPSGLILTNQHAVEGPGERKVYVVTSSGEEFPAEVLGTDKARDLALLKVAGPKSRPVLSLGESRGLKMGDPVWAFGAPIGMDQTMTHGEISALGRQAALVFGEGSSGILVQTDAAINPGNSGGPLVDGEGLVVGIVVGIYTTSGGSQGLGFAIPIDEAVDFLRKFRVSGS